MKSIIYTFCLILTAAAIVSAQDITDWDLRGFDELGRIEIDVDGDGRLDTIQPRTYQIKRPVNGMSLRKKDIQNWIAFDLVTSGGRTIKSFFKYNYGTAEQGGSYWVYALKSAGDINRDGKTDLIFYSGDDTSDETVTLVNKGTRFPVYRRKVTESGDW